jgi:hypothetical protein
VPDGIYCAPECETLPSAAGSEADVTFGIGNTILL